MYICINNAVYPHFCHKCVSKMRGNYSVSELVTLFRFFLYSKQFQRKNCRIDITRKQKLYSTMVKQTRSNKWCSNERLHNHRYNQTNYEREK